MKNIRTFHAVARGESHKIKNTPCQDAATSFENLKEGLFIGVVSDGHGSKQYFRSDRGSKILVDITMETVSEFVHNLEKELISVPFNSFPPQETGNPEKEFQKKPSAKDTAFRRLFSAIITKWNDAIYDDWNMDIPTRDQMKRLEVPDDYIAMFEKGNEIEQAYGCTLIAFARTPYYWLAFQLGDGKCIAFDDKANSFEPIPWDEKCVGNKTTSICENSALENFRYCYGNDRLPVTLFIGSDGMDGAFGTMDEFAVPLLAGLYENILKSFAKNGYEPTIAEIKEMLPKLSEQGVTRDDMSLAGWIDLEGIKSIMPDLLKREIKKTETEFIELEKALRAKNDKHAGLEAQIHQKQSHFEKKEKQNNQTDKEFKLALKAFLQAEKIKEKTKKHLEKLSLEAGKLKNEIQNLDSEREMTAKEIEKAKKNKERIMKKLDNLIADYERLNKDNKEATDQKGLQFGP